MKLSSGKFWKISYFLYVSTFSLHPNHIYVNSAFCWGCFFVIQKVSTNKSAQILTISPNLIIRETSYGTPIRFREKMSNFTENRPLQLKRERKRKPNRIQNDELQWRTAQGRTHVHSLNRGESVFRMTSSNGDIFPVQGRKYNRF